MPRAVESPADFTIIAENIHATRVLLRKGRRVTTLEDGTEVVPFTGESGEQLYLRVPESFKDTQPYQQGQIKHFMIAAMKGIGDDPDEREEGAAYVHYEVRRQTAAGASFLDLNVDEVSPNIEIEKEAMAWLMNTVQKVSTLPPSVDSSDAQIIATGLEQYQGGQGRPMINSLALDRMEALDLVREHNARVIVSAAGESGMPSDAEERVANVEQVLDAVRAVDIPLDDVFVDCLVFPISVSPDYGPSYLDAVTEVRRTVRLRSPHHRRPEQRIVRAAPEKADQRHVHIPGAGGGNKQRHRQPAGEQDTRHIRFEHRGGGYTARRRDAAGTGRVLRQLPAGLPPEPPDHEVA